MIIVWYYFLSGCKIIYVNFLPLWNPLIFLLCPPKTTFGPITGSIQINNSIKFKSILRKYFFPYLYRLSICILKLRKDKAFFATNILKKYLKKK